MIRLYRSRAGKSPEVSVALSASVSFFVFFALHAAVVAARHTVDAADIKISTYQSWMLKVSHRNPILKSKVAKVGRIVSNLIPCKLIGGDS